MFGIGFSEILLICLVMIIFIRPDDLPKALRTVGRYYGKAKKLYSEIITVKDRVLKEIDEATTLEEPSKPAAPKALPAGDSKAQSETGGETAKAADQPQVSTAEEKPKEEAVPQTKEDSSSTSS